MSDISQGATVHRSGFYDGVRAESVCGIIKIFHAVR